jgi:hypothetical protein
MLLPLMGCCWLLVANKKYMVTLLAFRFRGIFHDHASRKLEGLGNSNVGS